MKKRWIAAGLAGGLLLGAGALAGEGPKQETEHADTEEYVLAEYSGKVAVFCPQKGTLPRQITAIEVQLLPSADRALLQTGIPVEDTRALAMLLEDLGC